MIRSTVLLFALCTLTASATEQRTLAGTWTLKADAVQGQTAGGGTWSRDAMTGTLTIVLKENSLSGTWTGSKGEPWPFTGELRVDRFALTTSVRESPVILDGQPTTARFLWRFRGENDHDTLRGTMVLDREGEESERLQPFTATRIK